MHYEKISPALVAAVEDFERRGRPGLVDHVGTLGLVSVEPTLRPARIVTFLHCDEEASLDHLAALGVEVNQASGPIRTGIVPLESLDAVSDDPAVTRVVPARRLDLLMDVATVKVGVPELREATGLAGGGVVIGIVDTGIESTHPSFGERVLRIWDQTLGGPGVPEGGYGVELSGPLLQVSRDTIGHGTHVAGIAAGADDNFRGVAPEAELVIVKTDLLTAHIADGIRYVFRVARDLGRPAVVNLSLGGHGDAHDGTDSLSAILDAESGPGQIVCCAAGNEGNDNIHARVDVRQGRTRTISCLLGSAPTGPAPPAAAFNGWYSGEDAMEVAVVSPSGLQTPFQPVITDGSPVRTYQLPEGAVAVTTPGPDPANGDHNFLVQLKPFAQERPPGPGSWRLRLRGSAIRRGRVDVWSINKRTAQFSGRAVEDAVKVGAPAAASRAVSVASFTTKVAWQDIFGNQHEAGLDLDDVSDFSSEGPRRDGAEKPDLAAPGAMIVSALSVHAPTRPESLVDDRHVVMGGTSMASPFVAGLVALLLEGDPKLEPETAKEMLRRQSAVPDQPAGAFDPKWGYGLIDARRLHRSA